MIMKLECLCVAKEEKKFVNKETKEETITYNCVFFRKEAFDKTKPFITESTCITSRLPAFIGEKIVAKGEVISLGLEPYATTSAESKFADVKYMTKTITLAGETYDLYKD